jgi:hypothetical protein
MRWILVAFLLPAACRAPVKDTLEPGSGVPPPDSFESISTAAVPVTIRQRSSESVPGSSPTQVLSIDDITGGEVLVRLTGASELVALHSMRVGDTAVFEVGGQPCVLGLGTMVNRLIGEDHAVFHVGSREAVAKAQVRDLLRSVHESEFRFARDGVECSGPELAQHLLATYRANPERFQSGKQFLDEVVARPGSTTESCQVLGRGGHRVALAKWLRLGWYSTITNEEPVGPGSARSR